MKIHFADGIYIVVDDNMLGDYQVSNDESQLVLAMKDGDKYKNYVFDKKAGLFQDCQCMGKSADTSIRELLYS